MQHLKITLVACFILILTACGGSGSSGGSGPVTVEKISFTGITLSMSEGVTVGTLVEQQLVVGNGPLDISNITLALSGTDSGYFSVEIIAGESAGDYLGNISLTKSLLGLDGSRLEFTATVSSGDQSLSVPVVIQLTGLVKTLAAYQHSDVYNKENHRLSTSETDSGLKLATQPKHGRVEAYFVGNEMWDFEYSGTDCFEGSDSYLYQIEDQYGEVTININSIIQDMDVDAEAGMPKVIDLSNELPDTFKGDITVGQPANGTSSYNSDSRKITYTPNFSADVDSFTYAVNECSKTITVNISKTPQLLALKTDDTGSELWKTDGTVSGTQLVKDIEPGVGGSSPYSIVKRESDGLSFFIAKKNDTYGIWKTDGTESNTSLVKEITQQSAYRTLPNLLMVGDDVYLMSKTESTIYLWKSNGEEEGTTIVKTMTTTGGADASGYMYTINGKVVFARDTAAPGPGSEPWVSDGTAVGTVELKDIRPGDDGSNFMKSSVIQFKNSLYSAANDRNHGSEIWMTDGSTANTKMLVDLETGDNISSIPRYFTAADDVFYFVATTSDKGDQLWKSDGTAENTVAVKDIDPMSVALDLDSLGGDFFYGHIKQGDEVNGLLFFSAKNEDDGIELWKSDGTESGTLMVKDLMPGDNYSSRPGDFVELNNTLYFAAYALDNSRNLWNSDGTKEGTVMVKSFEADELQEGGIEVKNGLMFLTVRKGDPDSESGFEYQIWRSDGTESGTYFLGNIE